MDSFYIIAASNASTDLHPQNKLISFRNSLPQGLNVEEYKIALQSIFLDTQYGNISNGILSTKDHFLLFLGTRNAAPAASCTIEDFTLSPQRFVTVVNRALKAGVGEVGRGRIQLTVSGGKIQVTLNKSVLLVHPEIMRCLNFRGGSEQEEVYSGFSYTKLNSETGVKVFTSKNNFPTSEARPNLIKVQLWEMTRNLSAVNLVQDLAIIPTTKQGYPFYNICRQKEYFPLNTHRLSEISIKLVDENNFPLHLGSGQPTLLKFRLKKLSMRSFVLRLSSLESRTVFPDDSNSSFRIILQQPLDCSKWNVALSSIYLPNLTDIRAHLTAENFFFVVVGEEGVKRFTLEDATELTQKSILELIQLRLSNTFLTNSPVDIEEDEGVLFVKFNQNAKLHFSGLLAYLLSQTPLPTSKMQSLEGLKSQRVRLGRLKFDKLQPHSILLYCNFITPIIFGNSYARVLQIIPFFNSENDANNDIMKYEAQHLEFLPLLMNDPQTLQFEMRNSSGHLLKFQDGTTEIFITLIFREKM